MICTHSKCNHYDRVPLHRDHKLLFYIFPSYYSHAPEVCINLSYRTTISTPRLNMSAFSSCSKKFFNLRNTVGYFTTLWTSCIHLLRNTCQSIITFRVSNTFKKNKKGNVSDFWNGIKYDIPLCCILFFDNEWTSIRKTIPEYGILMHVLTNNEGVIMCPKCMGNVFRSI